MRFRKYLIALAWLGCAGCQHDPHSHLYSTAEPKTEDVVGTYVLDEFDLPSNAGIARPEVVVELRADGTFIATNIPSSSMDEPGKDFFNSLVSGTGNWEKVVVGTLDPGNRDMWGVSFRTPDQQFDSAHFTGSNPPHGLIFVLGDPDSGYAVVLKRKN
ncbi:MAG: hypothetical protein NT069_16955 [Planctomycetota bacterium]|nr:hypothetical protein [Planctomycetota bacterium]